MNEGGDKDHHKRGYLNTEGAYVIKIVGEDFYHFLNIKSNVDITNSDYLRIQTANETSVEYVWRDTNFEDIDLVNTF